MNRATHIAVKRKKATAASSAPRDGARQHDEVEDFEAIEQAVMATPRGRWFLAEYLRRHQNDETRRLVKALRKLTKASGAGADAERYRAALEQERAALDGIRLLLARAADALATDMARPAEETLPEAAASRLLELLRAALPQPPHHAPALRRMADLLREMARLLGEAPASPEALPESPRAAATPADNHPAPPSADQAAITPSGGGRQARIVIRKHEHSQALDIPLPEQQAGHAPQPRPAAQANRGIVRIRRHDGPAADAQPGEDGPPREDAGNVARMPQSANKVDEMQPSSLADPSRAGE